MAHTDRQPSDEIFADLQQAAYSVWCHGQYHEDYVNEQVNYVQDLTNFADNWYSILGKMDSTNQILLYHYIKRNDTVKFLQKQHVHYSYVNLRDKE